MTVTTQREAGRVLAAVDASSYARSVCEFGAWAALRLGTELEFVHVLDRHPETASTWNLSGSLGVGDREELLQELTSVDEHRSKLAQKRGTLLLQDAKGHAAEQGVTRVSTRMRNGSLVEALRELEEDVQLFVVGKRGRHAELSKGHLGGNLERVARGVHRAVLAVPGGFKPVNRFLIAFDGNASTRKAVEWVAARPLVAGLPCHLLMVGTETQPHREQLAWARSSLESGGFEVHAELVEGQAESVIAERVKSQRIDLLIMGAYGHSRVRQLIVGSTTTTMLRTCDVPVLLLR